MHSLLGDNSGSGFNEAPVNAPDVNGNLIGGPMHGIIDPLLGSLADNGGPTLTHALLPGSPAINAGDLNAIAGTGGVPLYDQRGEPFGRVFNGRIDIGAFEYQQPSDLNLLVDTLADESDGNYARGDLSLREAIELANLLSSTDTIRFDPALTATAPATIVLTMGELKITDDVSILGPSAELLTIDATGNDPTPNVNNGDGSRILNIAGSIRPPQLVVTMSGLSLTGGDVGSLGGAILSTAANLTIREMVLHDNSAQQGGALYANFGVVNIESSEIVDNNALRYGGGISVADSAFTMAGSIVSGNSAELGGGIYARVAPGRSSSFMTITDTSILNNTATVSGGGLYADLMNATTTITGTSIRENMSARGGGAVLRVNGGQLRLDDSDISKNRATGPEAQGAGLTILGLGGVVTIANSTVSENEITAGFGRGGGVFGDGNQLIVEGSTIADNHATFFGGGIFSRGNLVVRSSTVSGNSAGNVDSSIGNGGGIYVSMVANATVENSTISGNFAARQGGGIGASNSGQQLNVLQSTISGNVARLGGGINGGNVTLRHSTVTDNSAILVRGDLGVVGGISAPRITVDHSIVAGNEEARESGPDLKGIVIATYSLIGSNFGTMLAEAPVNSPDANGNIIGGPIHGVIDPMLDPLADNGGPTLTHALLPGSPAINAGDLNAMAGANGVPLYDQRGEPFGRVFNGRIDIGAFEYQQPSDLNLLVDTLADESDGDYNRGDLSLREAINLANLWSSTDTIRFDPALTASGPATILLTMGELKITDDVSIIGLGAELLTIDASGNDPTPDQNNGDGSRTFNINDGHNSVQIYVAIRDLKITGGDTNDDGGGVNSSESLVINSVIINGNSSNRRGGGVGATLFGAASVTILNSSIYDNATRVDGGGIHTHVVADGSVAILDSDITNNTSGQNGGGISIESPSSGPILISRNTILGNSAISKGGGIYLFNGTFIIDHNQIADNSSSRNGGGIYVSSRTSGSISDNEVNGNSTTISGGGIYIPSSSQAHVTIARNTVSHNTSEAHAGGIRTGGFTEIIESTIQNNSAEFGGGGLLAFGSTTIRGTTVSGNFANEGGGIRAHGPITVLDSTISGNGAETAGGGLWVELNSGETASLVSHTTITSNGSRIGGGIFLAEGELEIDHSIVAKNSGLLGVDLTGLLGASFLIHWSLVGNSSHSALTPAPIGLPDANSNLIGGTSASTQINPLLGPLANNGGPTLTHALLAGSPAINAGDPAAMAGIDGVPTHDQRGAPFTRVYGGRIDIGAFESQPTNQLAGDFNRDGVVDTADYPVWRFSMGSASHPGAGADGNGDGVVDTADYAIWRSNLGQRTENIGGGSVQQVVTHETSTGPADDVVSNEPTTLAKLPVLEPSNDLRRLPDDRVMPRFQSSMAGLHTTNRSGQRRSGPLASNDADQAERVDRALMAWLTSRADQSERREEGPFDPEKRGANVANQDLTAVLESAFEALSIAP